MKRTWGRALAALLCLAVMLCLCPALTLAYTSGQCGDYLYWSFNEATGALTFTGSGAMYSFSNDVHGASEQPPWRSVRSQIKSVVIPSGVTSIGGNAFYGCHNLTAIQVESGNQNYKVMDGVVFTKDGKELVAYPAGQAGSYTVPSGVTRISWGAFESCTRLTSVTIPISVTYIASDAFSGCTGLTSITIPSGVTSIGVCAFYGCTGLRNITIPSGVTYINKGAFSSCERLTAIHVASDNQNYKDVDGVVFTKDGKELVAFPAGRAGSYTVPSGVTSIGSYAFHGCTGLTSITIPDSVTSIGDYAFSRMWLSSLTMPCSAAIKSSSFSGCTTITNIHLTKGTGTWNSSYDLQNTPWYISRSNLLTITLHEGIANIGSAAFASCTGLTNITIPSSVTSIDNSAFSGCTGLTSITIPSSVTRIDGWAFYDCTGLTSITIPSSVTSIVYHAFEGCTGLADIYYSGTEEQKAAVDIWGCNDPLLAATWHYLPGITTQPVDVTAGLGSIATFTVVATDAESYQWQYQRPGESKWNDVQINGKSATFNQTNVENRHNGFLFRCMVTSAIGSVYSNAAKLTVTAPTTAPTITSHPSSVTKDVGITATFKVVATGATSYQWQYQKPGDSTWYNVLDNGKSATFNQTNLQKRHNGFVFRCKVTNGVGSVYSNTAKLTVITTAPTITGQPASVTKDLGTTATFKVTAANATSYQWQYQKPGDSTWYDVQNNGKSATFNQTNLEKRHNGFVFRCKVTNAVGSVYSNTAKLTVPTTAPTISGQPASVTKDLGTTATFKVTAANATSYQWQYQIPGSSTWNDVKVDGKSATFNQTNVEKRHNGFVFRCKVSNAVGSVYSNTAKLTVVTTPPTITSQPASVTMDLGKTATFKVVASNATSYQWQYQKPGNSTWYDVQNNGKSATFNQTNVEKRHNGYLFRCKVSNGVGSVYSNTAKLTVPTAAPTVSSHPSAVTKELGATATFKVTAANATSYQWQYKRPGESTWNDVQANGKSATFNQTDVAQRHDGFVFRCKVTNALGSVYSNEAKLTVN